LNGRGSTSLSVRRRFIQQSGRAFLSRVSIYDILRVSCVATVGLYAPDIRLYMYLYLWPEWLSNITWMSSRPVLILLNHCLLSSVHQSYRYVP